MKRRRYHLPPPEDAEYLCGELIEVICEEDKAGRPVAPPVELTPYDPTAGRAAGDRDGTSRQQTDPPK